MKKLILILGMLIGILIIFFIMFIPHSTPKSPQIENQAPLFKIGVIGPFTGNIATMGLNCRNAIELALKNNKSSPIAYQMIYEDDSYIPAKAAVAAQKLTSVDKVNALITCSAISGSAAVAIAGQNKTFMIGVIASAPEIANATPYSFLHWTQPHEEARQMLKILKDNSVKKVVTFELNHPGMSAIKNGLSQVLKENGIEEVTYTFQPTDRDFNMLVDKAKSDGADMWVLLTVSPSMEIIIKNMKDKNIQVPYTSIEVPSLMSDKSLFEGISYVDTYDGDPMVLKQYMDLYNTTNVYGVAYSYDAMNIIHTLVNNFYKTNGRLPDAEELVKDMQNLKDYAGAVGPIDVLPNGMINSRAVIKKIVDENPVVLEK